LRLPETSAPPSNPAHACTCTPSSTYLHLKVYFFSSPFYGTRGVSFYTGAHRRSLNLGRSIAIDRVESPTRSILDHEHRTRVSGRRWPRARARAREREREREEAISAAEVNEPGWNRALFLPSSFRRTDVSSRIARRRATSDYRVSSQSRSRRRETSLGMILLGMNYGANRYGNGRPRHSPDEPLR